MNSDGYTRSLVSRPLAVWAHVLKRHKSLGPTVGPHLLVPYQMIAMPPSRHQYPIHQ